MGRRRRRMAEHRKSLGLSQESLAEVLGVETSTVARWERGETTPQPWQRPRLADAFKVSVEEVKVMLAEADGPLAPDTPLGPAQWTATANGYHHRSRGQKVSVEYEQLGTIINADQAGAPGTPRRTFLRGIAATAAACGLLGGGIEGRRVGAGDVDRLSAITALYRSVDYECGGGMLYIEVSTFAESATALLDQPYHKTLGPRLLAAVSVVRQLAGWTAFDSCRHLDAQRHFLAAERMALAAGDVLLAARVRYCQARQYQHLRHNRDALDTLRLARDHLGAKSTAAVSTMLDGAQAASLAALGEGADALAALGRAGDSFDRIDLDREPDWMRFYDRGELLAQHGRVYRDLARAGAGRRLGNDAVRSTAEAIDAFGPQNHRSSTLNEVGLCSAYFLADEPEQAIAVGTRAIEQAEGMASPRVVDRLRNVRYDLVRHQKVPEVTEFARELATLGTGTRD